MLSRILALISILFISWTTQAQFQIQGKIVSEKGGSLSNATITLLRASDSQLVKTDLSSVRRSPTRSWCIKISDFIFKYSCVNYKFTNTLAKLQTSSNNDDKLRRTELNLTFIKSSLV